ncbi:hypothetical protein [Pokkaliibacter plantistimulans]|uniref:hypothetical protein n=1 Tax=Pokkaliibacter plantistimulans TaxID=1635171 RepID=UPI001A9CAC38|nr:hypothetical protein [Pokkaliibacter plantistimulans]
MSTSLAQSPNLLRAPKVVAIAQDKYLKPTYPFPDTYELPAGYVPRYGQDITYGFKGTVTTPSMCLPGNAVSGGRTVGVKESDLIPQVRELLDEFASNDQSGMARRLVEDFLTGKDSVRIFADAALNTALSRHSNISYFCDAAVSAPNSAHRSAGKVRIHQALKSAGWDINQMKTLTDLAVPAVNLGNKVLGTGDFGNGLGLMINGFQYAYVIATDYRVSTDEQRYQMKLKYVFYDVFGLDDDDLVEFGASSSYNISDAARGITAWWQLQHQFGYAPLVTRGVVERTVVAPTS